MLDQKKKGNKTMELKPGQIVEIYQDPFTKQRSEGKAQLVEQIDNDPELQRWLVIFLDDLDAELPDFYERNIYTQGDNQSND